MKSQNQIMDEIRTIYFKFSTFSEHNLYRNKTNIKKEGKVTNLLIVIWYQVNNDSLIDSNFFLKEGNLQEVKI